MVLNLICVPFWYLFSFFFRDGPILVVACGRDTISIASSVRQLASENVFVVQVCQWNLDLLLVPFFFFGYQCAVNYLICSEMIFGV